MILTNEVTNYIINITSPLTGDVYNQLLQHQLDNICLYRLENMFKQLESKEIKNVFDILFDLKPNSKEEFITIYNITLDYINYL